MKVTATDVSKGGSGERPLIVSRAMNEFATNSFKLPCNIIYMHHGDRQKEKPPEICRKGW